MKRICKHFSGGGNFGTRTQLLKGLLSLLLTTSAFTSCTNESDVFNQSSPKLDVKFGVALQQARAIFTDASLPSGSVVGAMLDDGTATDYDSYSPLYFTATGAGDSQTWAPNTDVVLTETKGTLYAYYPHDGNVDISAIPVDMTAADQTDWLYATPVADVNEDNASVAVTLNHALANINVSLVKGSYVGTGNVTSISVQSDGIAPKGTFNAAQATPNYTAFEDEGAALERTITTTLGGTATDIMVVPTGTSETITFNVTVDGTVFTATSAAVELEKGSSYKYTLTLNSTFMGVSDVSVTPWNPVTKESLTLEKFNPWDVLENGVYAVSADGSPVIFANADESCIAVALVVGEHKFWIEKNETKNTTSIKAAYTEDGASNTSYTYFYWGMYGSDNTSITNYTQTGGGGTSSYGYLPQANGSYASSSDNLSGDYTTWTSGALSDFNGKANTAALLAASDTDSYTTYANMATWCRIFNQTATENQGYTDWYIPACGQLSLMYLNMTAINSALTKIGGQTISSYNYWSSSETSSIHGWLVNFGGGGVGRNGKGYDNRVRFVRDIK